MLCPTIDIDHQSLVDQQYNIAKTSFDFDMYELHNWLKQKYPNLSYRMGLW